MKALDITRFSTDKNTKHPEQNKPNKLFSFLHAPVLATGIMISGLLSGCGGGSQTTPNNGTDGQVEMDGGNKHDGAVAVSSRIYFSFNVTNTGHISSMAVDGKDIKRMMDELGGEISEIAISPDGKSLSYTFGSSSTNHQIMLADIDDKGNLSNFRELTTIEGRLEKSGVWSIDGSVMVHVCVQDEDLSTPGFQGKPPHICTADTQGKNDVVDVTDPPTDIDVDVDPFVFPNGRIGFSSSRDGNLEIYSAEIDGSDQIRITNTPENEEQGAISLDGTEMVVSIYEETTAFDGVRNLHLLDSSSGKPIIKLTDTPVDMDNQHPAWLDDNTIGYDSINTDNAPEQENVDIYTVDKNGKNQKNLTKTHDVNEQHPVGVSVSE